MCKGALLDSGTPAEIARLVRSCGAVAPGLSRAAGIPSGPRARIVAEALFRALGRLDAPRD